MPLWRHRITKFRLFPDGLMVEKKVKLFYFLNQLEKNFVFSNSLISKWIWTNQPSLAKSWHFLCIFWFRKVCFQFLDSLLWKGDRSSWALRKVYVSAPLLQIRKIGLKDWGHKISGRLKLEFGCPDSYSSLSPLQHRGRAQSPVPNRRVSILIK